MQSCPSCEIILPEHAHFCTQCGHAFRATKQLGTDATVRLPPVALPRRCSSVDTRLTSFSHKVQQFLPQPVRSIIAYVLSRSQDIKPEELHIGVERTAFSWGWLPFQIVASALGMLSAAYAYTSARQGVTGLDPFFWLGILLIYVPVVLRHISPAPARLEHLGSLCLVGISLYFIIVMSSPTDYDEFLHWRTADDIARSGHLFSINTLLPTSPFYPGLEIATNALSALSGLDNRGAGFIIIGIARLIMILSLFMLYERITKSSRIAGIATLLYMTNSHFIFFDAIYSYESLALPLATFMLYTLVYHEELQSGLLSVVLTTWATLAAVTMTHHMTDFFFDGILLTWCVIGFMKPAASRYRWTLAKTVMFGVLISIVWTKLEGNPVLDYLSTYFNDALSNLEQIVTGGGPPRHLFVVYGGQVAPLWERASAFFSVALVTLCLPLGLLCAWQRYRSKALIYTFGLVALFYPVTHIFRFTTAGAEIADRSAAFLFIPIACLLSIFIVQFWPTRRLNWTHMTLITGALTIVYLGGTVLGAGPPWQLLPGPYLVAADSHSVEPEGIQAAMWARSYLGPNHEVSTDRTNQLLMGIYGDQNPVTVLGNHVDLSWVFFSIQVGPGEISLLRRGHVRYLVVDLRMSKATPKIGFYFQPEEPGAYGHTTPIPQDALTKFNSSAGFNRVFDSGDIVIYDAGGLINAS